MYVINGICYAGKKDGIIEISKVKPLKDRILLITFSSGETRLFDATCLKGPAFKPLEDEEIFMDVKVESGVVCWMDGDIDCAPEYMYEHSYDYETQ